MVNYLSFRFVWLVTLYPVTALAACPPLELIFARGTGELQGFGLVGTPLLSALRRYVPGTDGYSVVYPATSNFITSAAIGSANAVRHLTTRAAECPGTKFALSGYSQGAMVVHGMRLDATLKDKVIGIAVFGDPYRRIAAQWPVDAKSKIVAYCAFGDPVCQNGAIVAAHLTYTRNTAAAAQSLANFYKT
ncbi:unnamed protein product [Albugo candida]|nr:unnamed protein product [Albugo candida]|eukprot:CCI48105.1 unnamed protein product [Albugo candida]